MSFASLRARLVPSLGFVVAGVALAAAFSASGCKQSVGERCEIDSDCASGICGPEGTVSGMTSAQGLRCAAMLGGGTSTPVDGSLPQTIDAPMDVVGADAAPDVSSEAGSNVGDGAASDGATDALQSGG